MTIIIAVLIVILIDAVISFSKEKRRRIGEDSQRQRSSVPSQIALSMIMLLTVFMELSTAFSSEPVAAIFFFDFIAALFALALTEHIYQLVLPFFAYLFPISFLAGSYGAGMLAIMMLTSLTLVIGLSELIRFALRKSYAKLHAENNEEQTAVQ